MSDDTRIIIMDKLKRQDELCKKFWNILKFLANKYATPDCPIMVKIFIAAQSARQVIKPSAAISSVGAFLFKRREQIETDDLSWIINLDFTSCIDDDWIPIIRRYGGSLVPGLLSSVRNQLYGVADWIKYSVGLLISNEESKIQLCKVANNLLSWYCEFVICEKDIEILKKTKSE
jgi:hypothetical protein